MKKGWEEKNLGNLCRIRTGKKDVNQGNPDGEFPFFTCAAEHTFSDGYSFDTEALLIAGNGDVGKVSYYNGKFEAYQRTYVLSDFTEVSPRFLFLILDGKLRDTVSKQKLGNTMPYIKVGMLTDFQLPVPPLPEQHRIVGILDEAFAGLATAKANAEKNLQNARALFESHLQSVFSQRGEGWVVKKLGDVFATATGTTPPKNNAKFYGDFMPLAKPPELCDEEFDSAPDGLSQAGAAVARTLPEKSILVSCIGNLGKIGLNTVPVAFNQQINAILPDKSQAIPEFMFFQSLSPVFKSQLESLASGTTVPIVNKSKFNSVCVVLPPLTIQKPVVAQLSSLREETQRLAAIYQSKLAALEALKKSLLHQAFSGEL